jgi:hypothetical protein
MILSLKYDIHFSAKHFPGEFNTAVDMLSWLQVEQFKMHFPYMEKDPTPVPQASLHLWNNSYCAAHCLLLLFQPTGQHLTPTGTLCI